MRPHIHGPGCTCGIPTGAIRTDAAPADGRARKAIRPGGPRLAAAERADGDHYDFSTANAILAEIEEREARRKVRAQLNAMAAPSSRTDARPTEAEAKERMRLEASEAWQRNK